MIDFYFLKIRKIIFTTFIWQHLAADQTPLRKHNFRTISIKTAEAYADGFDAKHSPQFPGPLRILLYFFHIFRIHMRTSYPNI